MANVKFEWDEEKNRSNRRKHGVGFEEACLVFRDPFHLSVQDRFEGGEERWQTIGIVGGIVLLMVAHTFREDDLNSHSVEVIRIISARKATRLERRYYENENS